MPLHIYRMAKIQNTDTTKCWQRCGTTETPQWECKMECKMVQPLWKTVWWFYKIKHTLTIQSSNHTQWYLPKGDDHGSTQMFTTDLFIIAKTWKQPRCPSVGEEINCDTFTQQKITQRQKESSYQAMKRHGGTLNAYY